MTQKQLSLIAQIGLATNLLAFFAFLFLDLHKNGAVSRFFPPVMFLALAVVYFVLTLLTARPTVIPQSRFVRVVPWIVVLVIVLVGYWVIYRTKYA